jgi:drug/metabolite transporter (DMT)-like permease
MLGEIVGIRRWSALVVGLIGVIIVIRPGTGAFRPDAFWVLFSSSAWAFASVLTRRMAGNSDAASTLLWSAVTGLIILLVMLPFSYVTPTWREAALCTALGVFASGGQFLMVQAYRYAGAATLAPFSYVQLAWSTGLGFAIWGTLPDEWTWVGTVIIVASGIYTVHRERVRARSV